MGAGRAPRYDDPVRRYFTRRCIGLHITIIVLLPAFAWLTKWQLDRALGGNTLSWAYTFEWPMFAVYAIYVWWQLIHDQPTAVTRSAFLSSGGPAATNGQPATGGQQVATDGQGGQTPTPDTSHLEPGWALSGGRKKNVAIAARTAVDERGGRGDRFTPQTEKEAEELAEYNRYLAELAEADSATRRS
jgi:hypothetical protein